MSFWLLKRGKDLNWGTIGIGIGVFVFEEDICSSNVACSNDTSSMSQRVINVFTMGEDAINLGKDLFDTLKISSKPSNKLITSHLTSYRYDSGRPEAAVH